MAILVARREIFERVRGVAFAVSTLVLVVGVCAAAVIPSLEKDGDKQLQVGLAGAAPAGLEKALRQAATADNARLQLHRYPTVAVGEAAVREESVGVLVVNGQQLVWKGDRDEELGAVVTAAVQRAQWTRRAAALGLTATQVAALLTAPPIAEHRLEAVDPDRDARLTIAQVAALLLLATIIWYGSAVAQGVAQEKSSRVMEVLLSRVRAQDLLAGKVIGIGLVGLAQLLLAGIASAVAMLVFQTEDIPTAVPLTVASAVLWFALGYAFWSVVFAAVGALVSRSEDVNTAITPLTWLVLISAWVGLFATDAPNAWWAQLASFVPITAPFVVPVQIAVGDIAAAEVAIAIAIVLLATYALIRLAASVYSGALLRTGTGARPGQLWRAARGS